MTDSIAKNMPFAFINTKSFKSEECGMWTPTGFVPPVLPSLVPVTWPLCFLLCVCVCVICMYMGFPGSASKESTYNAGDPGSIPWSGSSPGEGIG